MKTYPLYTYPGNATAFIVSVVLVVLATLFLLLRLWARRVRKVKLWIDDYTIIADLVCLYALFAIEIVGMLACSHHFFNRCYFVLTPQTSSRH